MPDDSECSWEMMKDRNIEIRERALSLLGVNSIYERQRIRDNFLRQIKLVHPDRPRQKGEGVPGFDNAEIARLVIQAYGNLMCYDWPTTMLENDRLVGTLLNGRITPITQTRTEAQWKAGQFYDQFQHSIWPASPSFEQEARYKFKGL